MGDGGAIPGPGCPQPQVGESNIAADHPGGERETDLRNEGRVRRARRRQIHQGHPGPTRRQGLAGPNREGEVPHRSTRSRPRSHLDRGRARDCGTSGESRHGQLLVRPQLLEPHRTGTPRHLRADDGPKGEPQAAGPRDALPDRNALANRGQSPGRRAPRAEVPYTGGFTTLPGVHGTPASSSAARKSTIAATSSLRAGSRSSRAGPARSRADRSASVAGA